MKKGENRIGRAKCKKQRCPLLIVTVERQKGITTSHLNTQLDPSPSQLPIYAFIAVVLNSSSY